MTAVPISAMPAMTGAAVAVGDQIEIRQAAAGAVQAANHSMTFQALIDGLTRLGNFGSGGGGTGDVLSTGKAGGQTIRGGTNPPDRLVLDDTAATIPGWSASSVAYTNGTSYVTSTGNTAGVLGIYVCAQSHTSSAATQPGTPGGANFWNIASAGVGVFGANTETLRVRSDGIIVMGSGVSDPGANHSMVNIIRGVNSAHASTSLGTGLQIAGGADDRDPTIGNGLGGLHVSWRLVNGGVGEENNGVSFTAWSEDPNYPGLTGGGSGVGGAANNAIMGGPRLFHGVDQVNASQNAQNSVGIVTWTHQPNLFSMNPQIVLGYYQPTSGSHSELNVPLWDLNDTAVSAGVRALGLVTQQPNISNVEVGSDDRSRNGIIDSTGGLNANSGTGIRVTTTGLHDIMSAITIISAAGGAGGYPATYRHGLVMSTSNKAAGSAWGNSTVYKIGQCVTNGPNNGTNGFIARTDHTSGATGGFPGAGANWAPQPGSLGPTGWAIWLGQTAGFSPSGACTFGVNAGTGMPAGSVQMAGMLQMGTIAPPGNAPTGFIRLWYNGTNLMAIKATGAAAIVA